MATLDGPSGWTDENVFTADLARCVPDFACYTTTALAYTDFATEGAMIGNQAPLINDGEIFSGPGLDQAIGVSLTRPTSVVVVDIEGEWYQVVIDDMVVWIYVSQLADLGDCDGGDLPCNNLQDAIDSLGQNLRRIVDCCITQRVRSVNPTEAGPGDWVTIDPAAEARFVDITEHDSETWYEFDTDDHGPVWARVDNIVNGSACDRDIECPRDWLAGAAIADCPPPAIRCANGKEVASLSGCPTSSTPRGFTCQDGSVAETSSQCPPPPETCRDTDRDTDRDGICDRQDNCPTTHNPNQQNNDGDDVGDGCDNCWFHTNGFQDDGDGDGIGDDCEIPACPKGRLLANSQCCPEGSSADGPECFCQGGPEVRPGATCPPPCPQERQIPGGVCCPEGTIAWQTFTSSTTIWSCLEPVA